MLAQQTNSVSYLSLAKIGILQLTNLSMVVDELDSSFCQQLGEKKWGHVLFKTHFSYKDLQQTCVLLFWPFTCREGKIIFKVTNTICSRFFLTDVHTIFYVGVSYKIFDSNLMGKYFLQKRYFHMTQHILSLKRKEKNQTSIYNSS